MSERDNTATSALAKRALDSPKAGLTDSHPCTLCSLVFTTLALLKTHVDNMHNNEHGASSNVLRGSRKRKSVTPRRNGDIYMSNSNTHNIIIPTMSDEDSDDFREFENGVDDDVNTSGYDYDLVAQDGSCSKKADEVFSAENEKIAESNESDVEYRLKNGQTPRQLLREYKIFKCDVCGLGFASSDGLSRHELVHVKRNIFKCCICDTGFANVKHLHEHEKIHLGEKPYNCGVCGVGYTNGSKMLEHMRVHVMEDMLQCSKCCAEFDSSESLAEHKRTHADEESRKSDIRERGDGLPRTERMCKQRVAENSQGDACDIGLSNNDHIDEPTESAQAETLIYVCDVCGVTFDRRGHLYRHRRLHKGLKPCHCVECGVAFTYKNQLQKHMRIHTGEKPFKCDMCDKRFTQSGHLYRHKRKHSEEKPFSCVVCGLTFAHNYRLEKHMRKHTGEKRFKCDVCGKAFQYNSSLHKHRRMHTGEKPYKCEFCGKLFPYNSSLHKHKKMHTEKVVDKS